MNEETHRPNKGERFEHYKGGRYTAVGVGEHETTGDQLVVYTSDSKEHNDARAERGADFVLRPLNHRDGLDPWNSEIDVSDGPRAIGSDLKLVPRFKKIDPELVGDTTYEKVATDKSCKSCGEPIQPGQSYAPSARGPRHIGCARGL